MTDLSNIFSLAGSLLLLAACVLLWVRFKSIWILIALGGHLCSMLCRLALTPGTPIQYGDWRLEVIRVIWPAASFAFAIGLTGFAWTELEAQKRKARETQT